MSGGRLRVHQASARDAPGLVALVEESVAEAPSSPLSPAEVGDPERRVWEALRRVTGGHGVVMLGAVDGAVVAAARVLSKDFARSSHVASVALLVAPSWRRRGIGRLMLDATAGRAFMMPTTERLEMTVFAGDVALRGLLEDAGWLAERVERGAWMTTHGPKDLCIYVRDR